MKTTMSPLRQMLPGRSGWTPWEKVAGNWASTFAAGWVRVTVSIEPEGWIIRDADGEWVGGHFQDVWDALRAAEEMAR